MKKKLLLLAGFCGIAMQSFATVYTIQVGAGSGFSFAPSAIADVHPGDTVKWKWTAGGHTTTSTTIPATATAWNHPMAAATDSFEYVPTITGTYNYKCTPHEGMGMIGSFTVTATTGVAPIAATIFNMYPNPAGDRVQLKFNNGNTPVSVVLTDMAGRQVRKADYSNVAQASFNLDGVANGTYFIRVLQGGDVRTEQLVVAH